MKNRLVRSLSRIPAFAFYIIALAFLTGGAIGWLVGSSSGNNVQPASGALRLTDPEHKLISPLLLGTSGMEDKDIADKLKIETYDLLNLPNMKNISIYFRDMKTGVWAGINEDTEYNPASLLKVPIMIAWYKKAEDTPGLLATRLVYQKPVDPAAEAGTILKPGASYSIKELISYMIKQSDNGAKDLLLVNLDDATINSVFSDLGIKEWGIGASDSVHISPAIYSRFLRILYNASYLNRDDSEEALELLSSTSFDSGIVAGVPDGTAVAHKFGEYEDPEVTIAELHDCGIVYHPTHPYLLCVMTRGTASVDVKDLEKVLKVTSQAVYNLVNTELAK